MKAKGFTLIELLAVIIILAVIALIATPIILGIISSSKKGAFEATAYGISQAAKNTYVSMMYAGEETEDIVFDYVNGVETSSPEGYTLKYEGARPLNGQVSLTSAGKVALAIHDGKYCITKGYDDAKITTTEDSWASCAVPVALVDGSGANAPVLATGMTPVIWDGSSWVTASDADNPYKQNWYDYGNQEWANATTADGSMWVWIPRYVYKITTGWHQNHGGKNMIDPTRLSNNMGIDFNTGAEAATGTNTITRDYITIEPNTVYTITRPINSGIMGGRFYDANKNYLGGASASLLAGNVLTVTFTTPANAYYMKFIDQANTLNAGYQLEKNGSATAYEAFNPTGTISVQFTQETNDAWNNSVIGALDAGVGATASNNKWTAQPAFTFGSTKLTGIWVAKFEPSVANQSSTCYTAPNATNCDIDTLVPKYIPNATSWRYITVGNAFKTIRKMELSSSFGWTTAGGTLQADGSFTTDTNNINTHLIKNIEWGAASYLSKSQYGKGNNEIYINNSQTYTTGCAGNTASETLYNGCQNAYSTTNGQKASTTGNIYGIYDMSGGSWERVAAYMNNSSSNLNTNGSAIITAAAQYKDIYTAAADPTDTPISNYSNTANKKGDAVYEISNDSTTNKAWYRDYSNTPKNGSPWFNRGGNFDGGTSAGTYNFSDTSGLASSNSSFRAVLIIGTGL